MTVAARWRQGMRRARAWLVPPALVLMYHRIAAPERDPWQLAVTPAHFAEHLDVIRRHGTPMPVRALTAGLARGRVPRRAIVVTIDDGYADNLHQARPLLARRDVPATVFVAAGYLDRPAGFWWDELEGRILAPAGLPPRLRMHVRGTSHDLETSGDRQQLFLHLYGLLRPLADAERRRALDDLTAGGHESVDVTARPLDRDELRALQGDGLVEIGAHTVTHPQLSALPVPEQQAEIRQSRALLSEVTGREVVSFAYPYGGRGDYTADTVRLVAEAGFTSACTTVAGAVRRSTSRLELPRLHVPDCDGDGLARRLAHWAG